ncbi:uncharacterized protein ISCGN_009662 [Ixodes scapularis]
MHLRPFQICPEWNRWSPQLENSTKCTVGQSGRDWIGFEAAQSVLIKVEMVKKKHNLGIAVMHIELDDKNDCSNQRRPYLLSAVHGALHSTA